MYQKTNIMDIIFATNNNFCQHAAVAIASLLDNNKYHDIVIHLFCIDVTKENIIKITSIATNFNKEIKVYHINKDTFKEFPNPGNYSFATYLRLITATLIPNVDKALYLDCDLVVNGDIKELWNLDITGYGAAGVPDAILSHNIIKNYIGYDFIKEGYFNAGVLLLNLKYWRENNIQDKFFSFLKNHDAKLNDQDAINAVLHGKIKEIPPKWNCHVGYFAFPPLVIEKQKMYIKDLWNKAIIIHFTGPVKPWHKECVNPYKKVYLNYLKQTPYRNFCLKSLKSNKISSIKIIILRLIKNIVAKFISFTYK